MAAVLAGHIQNRHVDKNILKSQFRCLDHSGGVKQC